MSKLIKNLSPCYIKKGYNLSHITTLYVLHFINDTESFIKVGITIHNIKKRFQDKSYKKYNINTLAEYRLTLERCVNIEQHIKYSFRENQYIPLPGFAGRTECFAFTDNLVSNITQSIEHYS
jgi:hypothetical protein